MRQGRLKILAFLLILSIFGCKHDEKNVPPVKDPIYTDTPSKTIEDSPQINPNEEKKGEEATNTGEGNEPAKPTIPGPEPLTEELCEKDPNKIWFNVACQDLSKAWASLLQVENQGQLTPLENSNCLNGLRIGKSLGGQYVDAVDLEDLSRAGVVNDALPVANTITIRCTNIGQFAGYIEGLKQKFFADKDQPQAYAKCRNFSIKYLHAKGFEFRKLTSTNTENPPYVIWPISLAWTSVVAAQEFVGLDAILCSKAVIDVWLGKI